MAAVSIEGRIFEQLATILDTLSWVETVEYERPRIVASDWREDELPAIQFFDNRAAVTHARGDVNVEWGLSIELIMKQTELADVNQIIFLDKKQEIEDLIGAHVNLDILDLGMIHMRYDGWETDVTEKPYYVCRLDFTAMYIKPFTGC